MVEKKLKIPKEKEVKPEESKEMPAKAKYYEKLFRGGK